MILSDSWPRRCGDVWNETNKQLCMAEDATSFAAELRQMNHNELSALLHSKEILVSGGPNLL